MKLKNMINKIKNVIATVLSRINPIPKLKQLLQKNPENDESVCPNNTADNTNDVDLDDDKWILIEDEIDIEIEDGSITWEDITPSNNPWIATYNGFTEYEVHEYLKAHAAEIVRLKLEENKQAASYEAPIHSTSRNFMISSMNCAQPEDESKIYLERIRKENHVRNVGCFAEAIQSIIKSETSCEHNSDFPENGYCICDATDTDIELYGLLHERIMNETESRDWQSYGDHFPFVILFYDAVDLHHIYDYELVNGYYKPRLKCTPEYRKEYLNTIPLKRALVDQIHISEFMSKHFIRSDYIVSPCEWRDSIDERRSLAA